MRSQHDVVITFNNTLFSWPQHHSPTLQLAQWQVFKREQICISGPSGSGKSTLLALLAGIVTPQSGSITILGTQLETLSALARDRFRVNHIGLIFQQFNLIPYLSILDNILLPCQFSPYRRERALTQGKTLKTAAQSLLMSLDLSPTLWSKSVTLLSIGQQQRVAAARAFIGRPPIIIADEPTSALDADRQQKFLTLMQHESEQAGSTLIFASHDQRLSTRFSRQVAIEQLNGIAHYGESV